MLNYQILIVAVVCLAMGFLIGLIVSNLRSEPPSSVTPQIKSNDTARQAELPSPATAYMAPNPSISPTSIVIPQKLPLSEPIAEPSLTMIEQINEILQDDLTRSPLKGLYIKLFELPAGIVVWVDNQSYPGLDAVPEGEAKELIRMAVKKWESR